MIIAEACGNWAGNKDVLWDMVKIASECGADFFKVQTFYAKDLSPEWSHTKDRIKSLELTDEDHAYLVKLCRENEIEPMTSVYSPEYLPMLGEVGMKYIKLGSPQATDNNLLRLTKAFGFKVIVSTGGTPLNKLPISYPVDGVLHCVSKYPHTLRESNLSRMVELRGRYPNTNVGFSDHSDPTHPHNWNTASVIAMQLGAKYIERHFTILDREDTKDGPASITPDQLKFLCEVDQSEYKNSQFLYSCGIVSKQTKEELDLINNYRGRWNEFDYTVGQDTERP